jgi:hypothetical protein
MKDLIQPPKNLFLCNSQDAMCECGSSMLRKYNLFFFNVGKLKCCDDSCTINKPKKEKLFNIKNW